MENKSWIGSRISEIRKINEMKKKENKKVVYSILKFADTKKYYSTFDDALYI